MLWSYILLAVFTYIVKPKYFFIFRDFLTMFSKSCYVTIIRPVVKMRLCSSNKYLFVLWGKWWYADEKYAKCIPLSGSFMILTILCKIYYAFVVKDVDLMSND